MFVFFYLLCYNYVNLNVEVLNMPKISSAQRLTIPTALREKLSKPLGQEIAFCCDFNRILILNSEDLNPNKKVLSFRKLDQKGRFKIPKEVLDFLNASENSMFTIYLCNGELYIERHGQD